MTRNTRGIEQVPKLPDHPRAHIPQHPTRPSLHHRLKGSTEDQPFRSDAEPAFKRRRLGHKSDYIVPLSKSYLQRITVAKVGEEKSITDSRLTARSQALSHHESPVTQATVQPLLPKRPSSVRRQTKRQVHNTITKEKDRLLGGVQVKAFVPETPTAAPCYPSSYQKPRSEEQNRVESKQALKYANVADYVLWRYNHAEDILSETSIKHGFSDKVQISQAESSTARPSIWGSLKHKSGLQVLSSLAASILDQKQAHGTITTSCTFKPPPRVTLTDTKREIWLRDLSDPNIPLRRLSRTIPHGIRGRALLDQSLAKNIPVARSLWLAKCVGANEIRAFKRKGASGAFAAGGEAKWIRDWTTNVEQFLDGIISTSSAQRWTEHLKYGLRLATHLSAAGLLDKDHYFDWLLHSLGHSNLEVLAVYLTITRTHLEELVRSRRFGGRLTESLLEQLHQIMHHSSPSLYQTLSFEISDVVKWLIISSSGSLVLPSRWKRYEAMLRSMVGDPGTTLSVHFQILRKRNARLQALAGSTHVSEISVKQEIIRILDDSYFDCDATKTTLYLQSIVVDPEILVHVCLEWSASVHRCGRARGYVAAQLLRKWSEVGMNVELYILTFLVNKSDAHELEKTNLYTVVVDLIRLGFFSVSKYLQWIIANGVLRVNERWHKVLPYATGLIFQIPQCGLPTHLSNLRQNILQSIGIPIEDEARTIVLKKDLIERQFQRERGEDSRPTDTEDTSLGLYHETIAVKSSIGHWIWQVLVLGLRAQQAIIHGSIQKTKSEYLQYSINNYRDFRAFLSLLEEIEDFRTMAVMFMHFSISKNLQVLTGIAITVNHYLDIFVAIGAADTLLRRLSQRRAIRSDQLIAAPLKNALLDLRARLPKSPIESRVLLKDLQMGDLKLSVAVRSPISEHMAEALQHNDSATLSAYTDEVEQLLASGTSMDQHLLSRIFESIWRRFEVTWVDTVHASVATASLISRLASVDASEVNELTTLSVDNTLASAPRPKLARFGIPLVCSRSVSLEHLLCRSLLRLQKEEGSAQYHNLLAESLELLIADRQRADSSIRSLYYRFYAEQQRFLHDFSPTMVSILQLVLHNAHLAPKESIIHIANLLDDTRFLSLLRALPNLDVPPFERIYRVFGSIVALDGAAQTLSTIMSSTAGKVMDISLQSQIALLLNHIDMFSLPYRYLYLQAIMGGKSTSTEDAACHLISTISDKVSMFSNTEIQLWARLISTLAPEQRKFIRDEAEAEFFTVLSNTSYSPLPVFSRHLKCLLSLIGDGEEDLYSAVSATRVLVRIHEKFEQLLPVGWPIGSSQERRTELLPIKNGEHSADSVKFEALLHFLHIRQAAFYTPDVSASAVTQLLTLLSSITNNPLANRYAYLSDEIYDLLVVVSDAISPTAKLYFTRTLYDQNCDLDSRSQYLHGSRNDTEDSWLQLTLESTPAGRTARRSFPIRRWETMPEATPLISGNDTSVSLTLFGARKRVL
ncbi:MAG: hypothetical protein Q9219_003041 [cf. Caloplaca sp. 3 TL-2023]